MGILYSCHKQLGCTFELWDGTVSLGEWIDSITKEMRDKRWPAGNRLLTDLTTVTDISTIHESDLDEVTDLIGIYRHKIEGTRLAIVALKETGKTQTFARLVSMLGVQPRVATNVTDACRHLDLDPRRAKLVLDRMRFQMRSRRK